MEKIEKIAFIGDILRCHDNNPNQSDKITKVLHTLFKGQIEDATGIRPELFLGRDSSGFDRERFYSLCGLDGVTRENWLRIISGAPSAAAKEYLAAAFTGALVLCHEADSLVPLLEAAEIPYVDMRLSPIRFLDDVYFAFKSNVLAIAERLHPYIIPERAIHYAANRVASHYQARCEPAQIGHSVSTCFLPPGSLLLCGQIDVDNSLVRDGRIVGFPTFAEEIDRLIAQYDHVYYKPHPYVLRGGANAQFIRERPAIQMTKHNIYRLLSDDNLACVVALSSGVLREAAYFGRRAHALSHEYTRLARDCDQPATGVYAPVADDYFSPTFWADILSPVLPTRQCQRFAFQGRADFMRKHLGMWWGYELGTARGNASGSPLVRACRKAIDYLDPSRRIRSTVDPKGRLQHAIKSALGQHK